MNCSALSPWLFSIFMDMFARNTCGEDRCYVGWGCKYISTLYLQVRLSIKLICSEC